MNENIVKNIESAISELACLWRGSKSPKDKDLIANQYRELIDYLIKWGWNSCLSAVDELPDEYMPTSYLENHNHFSEKYKKELLERAKKKKDLLEKINKGRWGY